MSSRSKLQQLKGVLRREPIASVTVDVFDTLVLRDSSSEEERFLTVASMGLDELRNSISDKISAEEVYSFRLYTRDLAHRNFEWRRSIGLVASPAVEFEIKLADWLGDIVEQLAQKYAATLTLEARAHLVEHLTEVELRFESQALRPNHDLIELLSEMKDRHAVRVYLLSDMYLSGEQLADVLARMGVYTYDGLVTSSDIGFSKKTGRLFDHLESEHVFPEFTNASNVHIGDRRQNDFVAPRLSGSRAILYRTLHHQTQRLAFRVSRWRTNARVARHRSRENSSWKRRFESLGEVSSRGALFGASGLEYVTCFSHRATSNPDIPFVAVSSEATFFKQVSDLLVERPPANVHYFPFVNRISLLSAIDHWTRTHGVGSATLHTTMLDEVRSQVDVAPPDTVDESNPAWPFGSAVPDSAKHVALLDVGWMGTLQVLVRQLADVIGRDLEVSGIYLGRFATASRFDVPTGVREGVVFADVNSGAERPYFVPEIWEYIFGGKIAYQEVGPHLELQAGALWAIEDWRTNVRLSPSDFRLMLNRRLKKLLSSPGKTDRQILGTILWDVRIGAGMEKRPLIPRPRGSFMARYLRLFIHPRLSYREFVTPEPHVWIAGYARASSLTWFMKLSLFVAKRVGHLERRRF